MFCPKCGTPCPDDVSFCSSCGNALPTEPVLFGAPKKGSHKVPLLIMAIMTITGLICYFLFPLGGSSAVTTTPKKDSLFEYSSGTIHHFYAQNYTGGASLTVPNTIDDEPVLQVGEGAFTNCSSLEEIILPANLIEIEDYAFFFCTSLRGIYIPESVVRIGRSAFEGCTALEAICIHSSVQSIDEDAFSGCDKLHYILFGGTIAQWQALYSGEISTFTYVYCTDGLYRQVP